MLFLVLAESYRVECLTFNHKLLLLAQILDTPELHFEVVTFAHICKTVESELVNQTWFLIGEVIEFDILPEIFLQMSLKLD